MGVPQSHTGLFQGSPNGLGTPVEVLADALAGPALAVQADGFDDLVGGEASLAVNAGVGYQLGDGGAVDVEVLGQAVGFLPCQVALQDLGLLVGCEAVRRLLAGLAGRIRLTAGQVQEFLEPFEQVDVVRVDL
jgi:hypothetical protein